MNRVVALLLSVLSAFPSPQAPQNRDSPSGGATASVTVRLDGKGSIGLLAAPDRIAVERYEKDLKGAGLAIEEISVLVADEIQVLIAAAKAGPAAPGATSTSPCQGPGMGSYVRALVMQGVRGRDLAAAIHAEKARRRAAAGQGKGPGKQPARDPGSGKAAGTSGKTPGASSERKGPPKADKVSASRPAAPPSDESGQRPQSQPDKQKGGQDDGGGKPKGQPKDDRVEG